MNDQAAFRPEQVVERVRTRLIAAGAATELGILERLTGYELDVLIRRECGWGLTDQWTTSGSADQAYPSTGSPSDFAAESTPGSQALPSGCPQTVHATVAA